MRCRHCEAALGETLSAGARELPADFWDTHGQGMESWKKDSHTYYRVKGPLCPALLVNQFVFQEGDRPFYAIVKDVKGRLVVNAKFVLTTFMFLDQKAAAASGERVWRFHEQTMEALGTDRLQPGEQRVQVGDYVLIHAGFAIEKIDEAEAQLTLETLRAALDQGLYPE